MGDKSSEADSRYKQIRRTITNRYENRGQFFGHLVAFLVLNAILYGLMPFPVSSLTFLCSGLWFMGLAIHGVQFILTEMRERAIEQAIRQVAAQPDLYPQRLVRLTEDGELEAYAEDEPKSRRKRKNGA
jgi:uncharacterized membrane protein